MPEGDTIHYAANRIRPCSPATCRTSSRTPHPRFGRDRWPERLAGRAVDAGRRPRQAPVPALRGRPHDPLAPAHDRLLARPRRRRALAALAARRLARAARRGDREVVQFDGPVLELMTVARAASTSASPSSARTSSRPSSTTRASCAGCATTTRRARSATRCSTSARSPASATCGRSRAASRRGIDPWRPHRRGVRRRGARDRARARPRMQRVGARRQPDALPAASTARPGRPCPRCGDARSAARPVGRQPADLLVPAVPDLTGAASATRAPTTSRPATRSRRSTPRWPPAST